MQETNRITVRKAGREDTALLVKFIHDLAHYEKLGHECFATEAGLLQHLFGESPAAEALIAELNGEPAGFALFFHNFSTFLAKPGLYLEDLFVEPRHRRNGVGRALLAELARIAQERGCGRFEWSVLDWNKSAIDFYHRLGGRCLEEWRIFRVLEQDLGGIASLGARNPE